MHFILFASLAAIAHGQLQASTTPRPPNITVQPTDLVTAGSAVNLIVVKLPTKAFAVEYPITAQGGEVNGLLKIPCRASANPPLVKYSWSRWYADAASWKPLSTSIKTSWNTAPGGDANNAGMLTIQPYDKVADAGAYICVVTSSNDSPVRSVSVSNVLNLTAGYFIDEGKQANVETQTLAVGTYVVLNGLIPKAVPMLNASWIRSGSSDVGTQGFEISPDRTLMDENNNLHIPYVDKSLFEVVSTNTIPTNYYHFKTISLRSVVTDMRLFQLSVSGQNPNTATCKLTYQTRQLNLVNGDKSRIVCVFTGSPSIKVTYLKQDSNKNFQPLNTIITGKGELASALGETGVYGNTYMIGSAQLSDAGVYSCSATYPGGECNDIPTPITVTVRSEPDFIVQPSPIAYVVEGQNITLEWRIKGCTAAGTAVGMNNVVPMATDFKWSSSAKDITADNLNVTIRTVTLKQAYKPADSVSIQVYASNPLNMAISSVGIMVISPITFSRKPTDQLNIQRGAKASITCAVVADDALPVAISWSRFFNGLSFPIVDSDLSANSKGQFDLTQNTETPPAGLQTVSVTLTIDTSKAVDPDLSRGIYACNVSNAVSWNVASARVSFYGDDPVAAAAFELWMLGPILGGVAAIIFVVGLILVLRHNRGEKYEVEDEEIKKGYDPKKEASEQREMREYQRDREKGNEPLRSSQIDEEIEEDNGE